MTCKIAPELTWIPILSIIMVAVIVLLFSTDKYAIVIQEKMEMMIKNLHSYYSGIRVIKAFDNESFEEERTINSFKDYKLNMIELNRIFSALTPLVTTMIGISMVLILWCGGQMVASGYLEIGNISATMEIRS
ncbi:MULTISPECIES: ABC transporter transmembrane domain-containing protein [unclassified Enterococcus]|uniref:ABC transporter transmembrane domain-containing protein n=1 Tax=unclassified Enterococcus TaxID=2608891 RepID=UPI00155561E3|nr:MULTISPECIES: ABC transporter transmembrane domain-containing protein [unclassified Enterococcus]MBS7578373.1 hypothetical protein [Enterococcus sp. MMGLQ5-2]MBS7585557.1 hypothetical protein [Enterococcus sp. MMGLQ5-1]NPD13416.1 hypothetical protein [Enterococcus sp. MMGLQ5-1]NPD38205.1 hypothetical protein [Enterococcus sp. MMGLQ5-2]